MATAQTTPTSGAARRALAILTFINLFNYVDRFIVPAIFESIKKDFHLSDTALGVLGSGFIVVYMLASPVFGTLGDRRSRPMLIAAGVAIWSIATTLAGFAGGFITLLIARATVGIGEAAYGTIAPALLSDYFPKSSRGRVFAVFFAAIPVGSALAYVLGGLMDVHFGWRSAFYVAGAPGILLALAILLIKDPPRGGQDDVDAPHASSAHPNVVNTYKDLLRNRPYLLTVLGYAAYTFALGGLAQWTPSFFERVRGLSKAAATVQFGAVVVVTGFVGTFVGGWVADALQKKWTQSYLWVSGITALIAAPACLIGFNASSYAVYMTAIVIAELLVFASTGPVNSAIVNFVAPEERASAVALSTLCIHLFGDGPSPPLIGFVSDHSSLQRAFLIVPVAILVCGMIWTYAAWKGELNAKR